MDFDEKIDDAACSYVRFMPHDFDTRCCACGDRLEIPTTQAYRNGGDGLCTSCCAEWVRVAQADHFEPEFASG